jgi:hypothetical protein
LAGFITLYANAKAKAGYTSGRFPDGSVIVFDLLGAESMDSTVQEGERKLIGVMFKDVKKYAAIGGWGFEGFRGGTHDRLVTQANAAGCFGCHSARRRPA